MDQNKTLEQTIKLRLAAIGVDTRQTAVEVRESTAILTGTVSGVDARLSSVEALLGIAAVDQVVDGLRVPGERDSQQVYMKKGESFRRAIEDLFDPDLTREQYRAAKQSRKPT